ncbi:MAG: response regulator [Phycisphaeraceae bacterium]|nr:response regulator [Phycisphaeraceae bacterium]MCW5754423.1 response regulator [Phycisphaeraceae bacterium]
MPRGPRAARRRFRTSADRANRMNSPTPQSTPAESWREKKVFTTGEAALVCKVSQQTIIRCFDSGRLNGFRVPGSKFRRIPRDELLRFMRANGIPTDSVEGNRKRILVVDDDEHIVDLFQDLLGEDGRFEVRAATTGYDAGMLTESFKPDLIILDYMLPDINGNVVCDRIRRNDMFAETRILIVSGVVNQQDVRQLLDAGADEFIKKPFEVRTLMQTVTRLLGVEADAN